MTLLAAFWIWIASTTLSQPILISWFCQDLTLRCKKEEFQNLTNSKFEKYQIKNQLYQQFININNKVNNSENLLKYFGDIENNNLVENISNKDKFNLEYPRLQNEEIKNLVDSINKKCNTNKCTCEVTTCINPLIYMFKGIFVSSKVKLVPIQEVLDALLFQLLFNIRLKIIYCCYVMFIIYVGMHEVDEQVWVDLGYSREYTLISIAKVVKTARSH